eukprot:EG_transcript_11262
MYFTIYIIIGIGVACSIGLLVGIGALIRFYQARRLRRSVKPQVGVLPLGQKELSRDDYFASLHFSSFRLSPRIEPSGSQAGWQGDKSQPMSPVVDVPGGHMSPALLLVTPAQALSYQGPDIHPSSSMRYLMEDDLQSPCDSSGTIEKTTSAGTEEPV